MTNSTKHRIEAASFRLVRQIWIIRLNGVKRVELVALDGCEIIEWVCGDEHFS